MSEVEAVTEHWFSRRYHSLKGNKHNIFGVDSVVSWVTGREPDMMEMLVQDAPGWAAVVSV